MPEFESSLWKLRNHLLEYLTERSLLDRDALEYTRSMAWCSRTGQAVERRTMRWLANAEHGIF